MDQLPTKALSLKKICRFFCCIYGKFQNAIAKGMKLGNFSRRRADGSFSFIILPEKRKRGSDFLVVFSKK